RARDGAAERRRVEVAAACGLDVERAALQRDERLARARLLAVDEDRVLGADRERLLGDGGDVRLVVLPEVGRERVRDRAAFAHPGERAARVEAARERDADALADGKSVEDRAGRGRDAHRWLRRSASISSAECPSRAATKTVFSPAIVPAISARAASSIASASAAAKPRGVRMTRVVPEGAVSP